MESNKIKICITGCVHGSLNKMYQDIIETYGTTIDLILCTGDFQSIRNQNDLKFISVPDKYKQLGDFFEYYSGQKTAPILTLFIGGNHEASNVLNEHFNGGFICKNIYYIGRAGVVNYRGVKICGISGIYKKADYLKGHYERSLVNYNEIKSVYHVREYEIAKVDNIESDIDIIMSHDWPTGFVDKKDIATICKIKKDWKQELINDELGSPFSEYLLKKLQPKYWVCGHMHYRYTNTVTHSTGKSTKVIALDKCLKRRKYFDVIEISGNSNSNEIYIDGEWIAITKEFNKCFPSENKYYSYINFFKNKDEYREKIKGVFDERYDNNYAFEPGDFEKNLKLQKEEEKDTKVNIGDNVRSIFTKQVEKNSEEINLDI